MCLTVRRAKTYTESTKIRPHTVIVLVLGILSQESSRWGEHTSQFDNIPGHYSLLAFVCLEIFLLFGADQSAKKYISRLFFVNRELDEKDGNE